MLMFILPRGHLLKLIWYVIFTFEFLYIMIIYPLQFSLVMYSSFHYHVGAQ